MQRRYGLREELSKYSKSWGGSLKIVQIYTEFLPSLGGIQVNMYNICKELRERGHEVKILTSNMVGMAPHNLPSDEIIDGVQVIRFRALPIKLFYRLAFTPSIIPYLLSIDADVFHVFSFLPYFLTNIGCIISKFRKIPLIITPTYYPTRYLLYTGLMDKFVEALYDNFIGIKLLRKADSVIALTEGEARHYRENGVRTVHVIPVGVDLKGHTCKPEEVEEVRERFNLSEKVILCVGRLEKRKGIQYAIEAMPLVLKKFANAKLLIVGADWGYQSRLEDLTRNLGIVKNVVFAGCLSSSELSSAYELANVVVIPSIYEAFSHVVIEAWAHKKAVVATKTIGLAETISTETGILIDSGDYKALADAVIKIISDQELAELMGMNGYRLVKREFILDEVVNDLEKVYQLLTVRNKQRV
ncbi:MAG: glycosyltransferase family 4 protein [Candidatus Bathyarchaeia archaeon]